MTTNNAINSLNKVNSLASVFLSSSITNATGNGTYISPIIFDSVLVDVKSNYSTSTGLFTAPVTGNYGVSLSLTFLGLTALITSAEVNIIKNGANVTRGVLNPSLLIVSGSFTYNQYFIIPCSSNDTLAIATKVNGITKTAGLLGASSGYYSNATFNLIV